jgi:hypothetical protein
MTVLANADFVLLGGGSSEDSEDMDSLSKLG